VYVAAHHGNPSQELWSITCHMGSHGVTYHLTKNCTLPSHQTDTVVLDLPTLERWKAELTVVGLPVCRPSR